MEENIKLTFEDSAKKEILEFLNKDIDKEGFIVEKENPNQRVFTVDGEELSFDELGGIQKGSEVFIKKDLVSLMRLSKN
jgi:hypothetical protein